MQICVLVLDGVFDTGLSTVLDTLQTANELAQGTRAGSQMRVTVAGVRRRAKTQQGWHVPLAALPRTRPDIVIVPALGAKSPGALEPALARRDANEAGAALGAWSRAGTRVAAACTGTFVVANAGLLDGRRATTTWW